MTFPLDATGDDYCYLTTAGRVTGRAHEIEIWFAYADGALYFLAGARDRSDWVRNLLVDPAVRVRVRDVTMTATARVVTDRDEESRARALVYTKYQPRYEGELVSWRQRALPVAADVKGLAGDQS